FFLGIFIINLIIFNFVYDKDYNTTVKKSIYDFNFENLEKDTGQEAREFHLLNTNKEIYFVGEEIIIDINTSYFNDLNINEEFSAKLNSKDYYQLTPYKIFFKKQLSDEYFYNLKTNYYTPIIIDDIFNYQDNYPLCEDIYPIFKSKTQCTINGDVNSFDSNSLEKTKCEVIKNFRFDQRFFSKFALEADSNQSLATTCNCKKEFSLEGGYYFLVYKLYTNKDCTSLPVYSSLASDIYISTNVFEIR
ncbi:MAG: hypothetical protein V1824_00305, partial [archaeon]